MLADADRALGASYRLVSLIGRGASGEVWRAVDRRTEETVAAKLLRPEHVEDHDLVERFLRERSILTGLRHESVVAVRDLVVEGDRLAIVMEHVDGGSLRDVLRDRGPLAPGLALGLAAAVLDALAAAHERGVLHRDVKPDNVLLTTAWSQLGLGAVKLVDFGIARILADRGSTSTGLVGTPEYMAPEQLVTGAADTPADVYGAGVLLYELLAGRTPFAGAGTGYTVAHRHVTAMPPPLPVPDRVGDVLTVLLDKDPSRRPAARAAAAALRSLAAEHADLAALTAQAAPDAFTSAGGPVTEVRGLVPVQPDPEAVPEGERSPLLAAPLPDLGAPGHETMLRSMPGVPALTRTVAPSDPVPRARWRDPRLLALALVTALLVGAGGFWLVRSEPTTTAAPLPGTAQVRAQQQTSARPTGLAVAREAIWDPASQSAQLTLTYSAQRAPLQGPFLEVLPGPGNGAACPPVRWAEASTRLNRPSVTGLQAACAWAVDAPPVPAQGSVTVTATVPLALTGTPEAALQEWLQSAAAATEEATSDSEVTSTAYPVQRLTDIQVVAPPRTVSRTPLRLSLVPVWPNGPDPLNPLLQSPPTGDPSSMLVAVAGGTSGVRFSDGCSGALAITNGGLVVNAQSVAESCAVNARVGNFTDLASNTFTITTRGS